MLAIVVMGAAITEFLFQRFFHALHITVLAKHQRQHQPIVARADLAVGAAIAHERALGPRRCIRQRKRDRLAHRGVCACTMTHIARREQAAARDGLGDFTDGHAIHRDKVAGIQIGERQFMFRGNGLRDRAGGPQRRWAEMHDRPCREWRKSHQNVVARIELQNIFRHRRCFLKGPGPPFEQRARAKNTTWAQAIG